jgi:hypothetical protein
VSTVVTSSSPPQIYRMILNLPLEVMQGGWNLLISRRALPWVSIMSL